MKTKPLADSRTITLPESGCSVVVSIDVHGYFRLQGRERELVFALVDAFVALDAVAVKPPVPVEAAPEQPAEPSQQTAVIPSTANGEG